MSVLTQLSNKIAYTVNTLTYDPEAEKYATAQKVKAEADAAAAAKAKEDQAAAKEAATKKLKDDEEAAKKEKEAKERSTFDVGRAVSRIAGLVGQIVGIFLLVILAVYGSSLATNLNIYQDWPQRVMYAIYGFLFFWLVIPYVLLYRWYWKGLRPRFYALIPLVPYHFDNYYAGLLFSWMSFKPEMVEALEEWKI